MNDTLTAIASKVAAERTINMEQVLALRAEARRWSLKTTAATSRRNTAIAELHKAGVSYREIGRAVGLSHVAVRKIVTSAATADE